MTLIKQEIQAISPFSINQPAMTCRKMFTQQETCLQITSFIVWELISQNWG